MPQKNEDDNLENELKYCLDLTSTLLKDESISLIPSIREKINLLRETIENTQYHYTLSKDKDAGMFVCPAGHMAIRRAKQGKKEVGKNQTYTYYFDVNKCKTCSTREGCYKEGAKSKVYTVKINDATHAEQIKFQETEYFKEKSRHRYKVEAKNAELKNRHGFDRASSYGLNCMEMQATVAIFTVNLKRILKYV